MTSLAFNTPSINTNAIISLPSIAAIGKKASAAKNYLPYSFFPKNSSRKPGSRVLAIDWDLNMNELEFE